MTSVSIDEINGITVVSVSGHAGYSTENDIVCAALSAITESLLQSLLLYQESGKCKIISAEIKEDIGCCLFSFRSFSESETNAMMFMALNGYKMLHEAYPDCVTVSAAQVGEKF